MKKSYFSLLLSLIFLFITSLTLIFFLTPPNTIKAQEKNFICILFPFLNNVGFGINSICGSGSGENAISETVSLIRFGLSLIFIAIIIIAIFVIVKASLKYIQAEGDENKVKEARKSIQNVFIGIAALFIGVLGIIIILAFFGATGALNQNDNAIPNSIKNLINTDQTNSRNNVSRSDRVRSGDNYD